MGPWVNCVGCGGGNYKISNFNIITFALNNNPTILAPNTDSKTYKTQILSLLYYYLYTKT